MNTGISIDNQTILEKSPQDEVNLFNFEPVYLQPAEVVFRYEQENLTLMLSDGKYFPRVTLRRCFPFTNNEVFITVKTPDTEKERGKEIGIITNLEMLDFSSRESVLHELKLHYFVPVIQKIEKIHEEYGFMFWKVETDRGQKEFIMRDNIVSSTRQIGTKRWLLIDINQARYEVNEDLLEDSHSRKLLVRYLLL